VRLQHDVAVCPALVRRQRQHRTASARVALQR
jgi:hypothetical protein